MAFQHRFTDGGEADDKIVAVLENDNIWEQVAEISDLLGPVERLHHYFMTYKLVPGDPRSSLSRRSMAVRRRLL